MAKSVPDPKKFVISCRVNDRELQILQNLANQSGSSISALLRNSLVLLAQDFSESRHSAHSSIPLRDLRTRSAS